MSGGARSFIRCVGAVVKAITPENLVNTFTTPTFLLLLATPYQCHIWTDHFASFNTSYHLADGSGFFGLFYDETQAKRTLSHFSSYYRRTGVNCEFLHTQLNQIWIVLRRSAWKVQIFPTFRRKKEEKTVLTVSSFVPLHHTQNKSIIIVLSNSGYSAWLWMRT